MVRTINPVYCCKIVDNTMDKDQIAQCSAPDFNSTNSNQPWKKHSVGSRPGFILTFWEYEQSILHGYCCKIVGNTMDKDQLAQCSARARHDVVNWFAHASATLVHKRGWLYAWLLIVWTVSTAISAFSFTEFLQSHLTIYREGEIEQGRRHEIYKWFGWKIPVLRTTSQDHVQLSARFEWKV